MNPAIRKLLVEVDAPLNQPGHSYVDREKLRELLEKLLRRGESLHLDESAEEGGVLRVRVGAVAAPTEQGASSSPLRLGVIAELSEGGNDGIAQRNMYRGQAKTELTGSVRTMEAVEQAALAAFSQIEQARSAANLKSAVLIQWLGLDSGQDNHLRRQAIRILGARRESQAVPALSILLLGDEPDMSQLALGALAMIGDERAVDSIIAYSENKPAIIRRQCVEAIRTIGSPKALPWLFTLSTGHPDPDIQVLASQALGQIEGHGVH